MKLGFIAGWQLQMAGSARCTDSTEPPGTLACTTPCCLSFRTERLSNVVSQHHFTGPPTDATAICTQAHYNARTHSDEYVVDLLVSLDRVKVLVHDLLAIEVGFML